MFDQNIILNTCHQFIIAQSDIVTIVKYSHVIPTVLSLILGIFVFIKSKFNFFSKIFASFILIYCIWLIGDLIIWTLTDYNLIYTVWSFLLYIEIVFYLLAFYFALVFVKKKDISILFKIILFLFSLPPLILTVMKYSVTGFYQPWCEAGNNNFLNIYKLFFRRGNFTWNFILRSIAFI